jgi:hypothetical protein
VQHGASPAFAGPNQRLGVRGQACLRLCTRWFVLSARYGLVAPDAEIAPYDYTLNVLGVAERKDWATHVLDKLLPELASKKRAVMFAGHRYREFLVEPLRQNGIEVQVPMANLTRGKQLAWLSEH